MADRHQILRRPIPHRLPRRLLTLPHRHRPPQRSHNQQDPSPARRNPPPRKNTKTGPQRSRLTVLQRRQQKQLHQILRAAWHRAYLRFHWKTHHARQDRTILANVRTLLSQIQQPHTIQRILQPETTSKPKLLNPSRSLPQPMSLQNVLDSRNRNRQGQEGGIGVARRLFEPRECGPNLDGNRPTLPVTLSTLDGQRVVHEQPRPIDTGFAGAMLLSREAFSYFERAELPESESRIYRTLIGPVLSFLPFFFSLSFSFFLTTFTDV